MPLKNANKNEEEEEQEEEEQEEEEKENEEKKQKEEEEMILDHMFYTNSVYEFIVKFLILCMNSL